MREFFMAALPWSCMGVAVAVAMVVLRHEKVMIGIALGVREKKEDKQ